MKVYATLLFLYLFAACKTEELAAPEAVKNIEGSWRIRKATRNGTDLTNIIDFTRFRVNFLQDKTYTIDNQLPFIVNKKGTWSLDDPQYPFSIAFRQEGVDSVVATRFDYPVVDGGRTINLIFSPGCKSNTYMYTLEKTAN